MGRPVVHWELWTKSRDKISDFYRRVFDWKIEPAPGMEYNIVDTGGQGGINGGIMTPQHEGPWPGNMSMYIDVDDLAAYRHRVKDAGGKILVEDQQVPGMGRSRCSPIRTAASSDSGRVRRSSLRLFEACGPWSRRQETAITVVREQGAVNLVDNPPSLPAEYLAKM